MSWRASDARIIFWPAEIVPGDAEGFEEKEEPTPLRNSMTREMRPKVERTRSGGRGEW